MNWTFRRRIGGRRGWLNLSRSGVSASARGGPLTANSRGRWWVRLPLGFGLRGRMWR